jgi:hypothetical protein
MVSRGIWLFMVGSFAEPPKNEFFPEEEEEQPPKMLEFSPQTALQAI